MPSELDPLGAAAFQSEALDCQRCHGVPSFASGFETGNTPPSALNFRNNAIHDAGGDGSHPAGNPGRGGITGLSTDAGEFCAPSLKNIATLDDVIGNHEQGRRTIASGANAGDGHANPDRDPLVEGFVLSDLDRADPEAFLESLTDDTLVKDQSLLDPFAQ